jgi:hypothetical protein
LTSNHGQVEPISSVPGGTPSDDVPSILATGRSGVTTIFASMTSRHPEGRDAEYLRWHTFDHRPEQYRLPGLRSSLRLVSTPECRAARPVSAEHYDAVDHIVTYFFADLAGLEIGRTLTEALQEAGRIPEMLPSVEAALFRLEGITAAPRIKIGADVLPWWPSRGVYVLIERGAAPAGDLTDVPGVGGVWWASLTQLQVGLQLFNTNDGRQLTYCFLDDDPVTTAAQLAPVLDDRWASQEIVPLLAAPFYPVAGYDFDRHLP